MEILNDIVHDTVANIIIVTSLSIVVLKQTGRTETEKITSNEQYFRNRVYSGFRRLTVIDTHNDCTAIF